jgi:transketolase C-terminal domain/subunit
MKQLISFAKKQQNLVVLVADGVDHDLFADFSKYFGEKIFTFGLAASTLVSAAAGMAAAGKFSIIFMPKNLALRCFDQFVNDVCKPNYNVKLVLVDSGFSGSEHDDIYEYFRGIQNLKFGSLSNAFEKFGPFLVR